MSQWNQPPQQRPYGAPPGQYREPYGNAQQRGFQRPATAAAASPLLQTRGAAMNPVFSRTMGLVALTTAFFALGAWLGRGVPMLFALIAYGAAFAVMLGMFIARRASTTTACGLLFAFGGLMGVAFAPTLALYARADPLILVEAGGATALFMAGLGAAGHGMRRDLSMVSRVCSWALLGLIVFGIVQIFIHIPGGGLLYSVLGLIIFAGLTLADFQRLRRADSMASAPYLAVSIFLDALNVFMFFLNLFGGRRD